MFGLVWDVFVDTPTGNQRGPPSTSFARAEQLGVRLRSTRYARLRSASPQMGEAGGKEDKLQKQFYTGPSHFCGELFLKTTCGHNMMGYYRVGYAISWGFDGETLIQNSSVFERKLSASP